MLVPDLSLEFSKKASDDQIFEVPLKCRKIEAPINKLKYLGTITLSNRTLNTHSRQSECKAIFS